MHNNTQSTVKDAAILGVAGLCGVVGLGVGLAGPELLAVGIAVLAYALGAGAMVFQIARSYPHARLGLCNRVTFLRLVLTTALLAPLFAVAAPWAVLGLALFALVLDGVDGWLARREGLVSAFGARFDMEVDAALGLILALNVWVFGTVGLAVLVLGLPRYVFVASAFIWSWMERPLPPSRARKLACAIQIGALIVLLIPGLPSVLADVVLLGAAIVLLWSFGRDTFWLYRRRGQTMLPAAQS
jgi:phosphatidylglycerophosphate synthase